MSLESATRRAKLVSRLEQRGIRDHRVLRAMGHVAREEFVPDHLRDEAYDDVALPIECEQTISQPTVVAMMVEALALQETDCVLDVGTGSGYAAAVMAEIADCVCSIERHAELAALAAERFSRLEYANVEVSVGDGNLGWSQRGPFQAIMVAAATAVIPAAWIDQLAVGGRLIVPLERGNSDQQLTLIEKTENQTCRQQVLANVRFVPLVSDTG